MLESISITCNNNQAKLIFGDCCLYLKEIPDNSIELIITDPPYFIDGLDKNWDENKLQKRVSKSGVVGGLPIGMKFDRQQGQDLQNFMMPVASEFFRILKPGAFCIVFSQARLYHRMGMSLDLAGFEIRDMLAWRYEGQAKAFSQTHFIKKDKTLSEDEQAKLIDELQNYKTPQLKPQIEPMVLAQKPREGTFVQNWIKYGVGLIKSTESLNGRFPGNVMEISKQEKSEKVEHLTVKPVKLISHLVRLFSRENQTVLDAFMGSGTTGVSALSCGRNFIGFEKEEKYFNIAKERVLSSSWCWQ